MAFPTFYQFSRKIEALIPLQWSHTQSVVEVACKYYCCPAGSDRMLNISFPVFCSQMSTLSLTRCPPEVDSVEAALDWMPLQQGCNPDRRSKNISARQKSICFEPRARRMLTTAALRLQGHRRCRAAAKVNIQMIVPQETAVSSVRTEHVHVSSPEAGSLRANLRSSGVGATATATQL